MHAHNLYVRSALATDGLLDFITDLGGDTRRIARDVGLDLPPYKAKIHFNSWSAQCRLFEIASDQLNEPYLGLKWAFAMPADYHNSGPTVFLSWVASDMRHFLDMSLKYQKIHTNGIAYSFEEDLVSDRTIGVFSMHPFSPPGRQMIEQIMAGAAVMGYRHVPNFKLHSASFQHNAPADLSWYEKAFQCEVQFNAARNTLVTDLDFLKIKRTKALTKIISPMLKTYLDVQVRKHPKNPTPFTLLIAETLPNILGSQNSDIETVAEALKLHPKKMQRLLNDEDTSYSQILDDVKKNLADKFLSQSDMPIGQIAKILDYSSDRSLGIATRRWFDLPPSEYRKLKRPSGN